MKKAVKKKVISKKKSIPKPTKKLKKKSINQTTKKKTKDKPEKKSKLHSLAELIRGNVRATQEKELKAIGKKIKSTSLPKKEFRSDWAANDQIVSGTYMAYYDKTGNIPTLHQMKAMTGFTIHTIRDHINKFDFEKIISNHPVRLLVPRIIEKLGKRCELFPDAKETKLFMQIVEKWVEKQMTEHSGSIGINQTIKAGGKEVNF